MQKKCVLAAAAAAAVAIAGPAPAQTGKPAAAAPARAPAQVVTGPVSNYWMSVETSAGFGAGMMGGAGGGGGRPSLGSIMGMMGGGAGSANHTLRLQLGSGMAPAAPAADHTVPAGFGLGPKLPLLTPRAVPEKREEPGEIPKEYQRPRGRMLIFWGCGERARPGQPVVLDFAQMAEGRIPPAFANAMKGLDYTPMQPPSPSRNKTYGEWPNEKSNRGIPAGSSLVGPHKVEGNYTAPISFMLTPNQDYMPPLGLRTAKTAGGAAMLNWTPAPTARGYIAMAVGGGQQDTVALWISTEGQAAAFGLPDYLSPGEVTRLVANKALLPGTASSCAVPKEFVDAAPTAFVNLAGYGDEANFSYPPRPTDPRTPWNIEWTVKARYRTADSGILGMDMGAMMGGGATAPAPAPGARGVPGQGGAAPAPAEPPPSARDAVMKGLGSAIGRGLLGGR